MYHLPLCDRHATVSHFGVLVWKSGAVIHGITGTVPASGDLMSALLMMNLSSAVLMGPGTLLDV